jgi:hypothetical protein
MFAHIDTLTRGDDPKHKILEELCRGILDESFSIVIVRIRPSLKERRQLKGQTLASGHGVWVLSFTRPEQVPEIMHLINIVGHLHVSRIQIVIGTASLPAAIREKYESACLSSDLVRSSRWLQGIEEFIAGAIDPLDDDLNISGSQALRKIVGKTLRV